MAKISGVRDFEKLGAFYLGRAFDVDADEVREELLLYDSKDLTTHAVCVGMTGSGKTGLCISLLEEAAIDGIPALVVDPKGDMGNLLLNFPELAARDFRPWIDPGEAARKGQDVDAYAASVSDLWRKGLESWGQDGARVQRLADAAEFAIYTPGSDAGRPLTVLRSFDAPPPELLEDSEAFGERIQSACSGLLALLGIDSDPIRSREAILLAKILQTAWSAGRDLTLADLIREVQSPPFDVLGVLDLESFFPSKDRFGLAMSLNGVLASPSFAPWLEGDPLDIGRLLYTPEGKPRIAVLSIAHLSDAERMFFVTILLNEVVAWMRTQPGTSSLRALLYMDEIFGYFPPVQEPPSKKPMLSLLKQARAYGLGVVLATQNPVDLDYKGLSNTGTWFIGRLQTERDKERVLDGLEGAMTGGGKTFDRQEVGAVLSGLGKRVFLMNNVHEDAPVVFHTRWALSYLRGPLTRKQIQQLMAGRRAPAIAAAETKATAAAKTPAPKLTGTAPAEQRPVLPTSVTELFLPRRGDVPPGHELVYRPALACRGRLHYANARAGIDFWKTLEGTTPISEGEPVVDWDEAEFVEGDGKPDRREQGDERATFASLPADALRAKSYATWARRLKSHFYEKHQLVLFKSKEFKLLSEPGETEGEFRVRVTQAAHEKRDVDMEKLRKKYAPKLERIHERIRKAEERVGVEEEQHSQKKRDSWISVGSSILGSLFGRKLASSTTVRSAGSVLKSRTRVAKEKADIERAQRDLEARREDLSRLEAGFEEHLGELETTIPPGDLVFSEQVVRPRKSDISVGEPSLVWIPYQVDSTGIAEPV